MIPKIIHLCWLSGDSFPDDINKCIKSVYKNLPDYQIKIWTKENFDINSVLWVKEAFNARKFAFAADYIRFWCLYNYGGIYLDCDVEVLKTFNEFLDNQSFIGFEYLNIPEAAVIGAEKGLYWIKRCLDWYDGKSFFTSLGEMRTQIVPNLIKLVVNQVYNKEIFDNGKVCSLGDLTLYPYCYFSPKSYFSGKIKLHKNTIAIHRFASAWGPGKKRMWTLMLHEIVICFFGKRMHDRIYVCIKDKKETFNGEVI